MTERNQCGCANEGLGMDATSGVTPPLLPTLVMALVLGAASLLCREPDAPAPAPAPMTAISTTMAPRIPAAAISTAAALATEAAPTAPFVPAALTFPRQFPLVVAAVPMPVLAQHRPAAAPRVASLRRAVPVKAPVAEAARVDPVVAQAEAPVPGETDDFLPDLALPFAPAIRAVGRARDFVGSQGAAARTQATALGGAVVDFVGTLR